MGKASSSKKVARAASTGGGRTARGRTPWLWYTTMLGVVAVGMFLVIFSRNNVSQAATQPPTLKNHWHTAYAIDICGRLQPNIPQPATLIGIHTHGDGLIHVEPQNSLDTGKHATLGRFVSGIPGFKLSSTSIQYPGERVWKNGDKCGNKPGQLLAEVWDNVDSKGVIVGGDPNNIAIKDNRLLTIGFVARGTSSLPIPPSRFTLPSAANITGPPTTLAPLGTPTSAPSSTPTTAATPTSAPPPTTATSKP
jgi:hypothetical protein